MVNPVATTLNIDLILIIIRILQGIKMMTLHKCVNLPITAHVKKTHNARLTSGAAHRVCT